MSQPAASPRRRLRLAAVAQIIALARPEWRRLLAATVALLITTGLNLVWPRLIQEIVDGVMGGEGIGVVDRFAGLLLVLFAAGAVFTGVRAYLFTVAGERIVASLRRSLYRAIVHLDIGFFDGQKTGDLINRLASDTAVVQRAATVNVSMLLRYVLTILGATGILIFTSWRLTLVMLALVPLAVVGALIYGRFERRFSRKVQDALARATDVAQETLGGIRTVRAFAREDAECARYDVEVETAFELAKSRARFSGVYGGATSFIAYGAISGVLWYGGRMLAAGEMTVGVLTSFLLYTFTVAFSIAALGMVWQDFMRAVGASDRVFELLGLAPTPTGGLRPDHADGRIELQEVHFAYPTRAEHPVLEAVSLSVLPGELVALVGPSGGGKSTIAALLSRLYDPTDGAVLFDGHDTRLLDANWLRRQIGVVAQEPTLFATSVRENVRYGKPDASDAEVEAAARAANAHDFVMALPEGYDAQVGERGVRLSGGQKQRIAIARALLEDPPVLVLDEATSALDAESEALVQQALGRLMRGRATLVIAHRLSTVVSADRIVVIDGGRVAQVGTHAGLMAAGGLYKTLVQRQFAPR